MSLDLTISDMQKSVIYAIVDDLAAQSIVGTVYQDKYVWSIQCNAPRVEPAEIRKVHVMDKFDSFLCTIESEEDTQTKKVQVCGVP